MDVPREPLQSLPDDADALPALVLATIPYINTTMTERDTLLAQNGRLRHLLLKLTRMHFGARSERLPGSCIGPITVAGLGSGQCVSGDKPYSGLQDLDRRSERWRQWMARAATGRTSRHRL